MRQVLSNWFVFQFSSKFPVFTAISAKAHRVSCPLGQHVSLLWECCHGKAMMEEVSLCCRTCIPSFIQPGGEKKQSLLSENTTYSDNSFHLINELEANFFFFSFLGFSSLKFQGLPLCVQEFISKHQLKALSEVDWWWTPTWLTQQAQRRPPQSLIALSGPWLWALVPGQPWCPVFSLDRVWPANGSCWQDLPVLWPLLQKLTIHLVDHVPFKFMFSQEHPTASDRNQFHHVWCSQVTSAHLHTVFSPGHAPTPQRGGWENLGSGTNKTEVQRSSFYLPEMEVHIQTPLSLRVSFL